MRQSISSCARGTGRTRSQRRSGDGLRLWRVHALRRAVRADLRAARRLRLFRLRPLQHRLGLCAPRRARPPSITMSTRARPIPVRRIRAVPTYQESAVGRTPIARSPITAISGRYAATLFYDGASRRRVGYRWHHRHPYIGAALVMATRRITPARATATCLIITGTACCAAITDRLIAPFASGCRSRADQPIRPSRLAPI